VDPFQKHKVPPSLLPLLAVEIVQEAEAKYCGLTERDINVSKL